MDGTGSTLIILGGTGDLASRLLLPGLGRLLAEQPERRVRLIGSGTSSWSDDRWKNEIRTSFGTVGATGPAVDHALAEARYAGADVSEPGDMAGLLDLATGDVAVYFALPPAVTTEAVRALRDVELPEGTVLAMEKPFGTGRDGAEELDAMLHELVPEDRVFRIDHFLGTSTVLNVLGLRFVNRLFEPVWNRDHVARVEIVDDEELGLEGRAGYYDGTGALVDMLQSHLLQVMSPVTMEPPPTVTASDLRAATSRAVRSVRLWAGDPARAGCTPPPPPPSCASASARTPPRSWNWTSMARAPALPVARSSRASWTGVPCWCVGRRGRPLPDGTVTGRRGRSTGPATAVPADVVTQWCGAVRYRGSCGDRIEDRGGHAHR